MNVKSCGGKLFWAVAPLLWGALTWFLAFGPGKHIPLPYNLRVAIGILILGAYFYQPLTAASKRNVVTFFEYTLPVIEWQKITLVAVAALLAHAASSLFVTWPHSVTVMSSLIFGVCAGPCLEELLARSFFITYRMSGLAFIVLNTISATTFTLMHAGYTEQSQSLHQLFFINGHFGYAFLLGIIAYKSQRIEVSMIMHMLSNFLRYTLPTVILQHNIPLIIFLFPFIELLLASGISHKKEAA